MKKYQRSIFIFRRDLRLNDNTGLIEAIKSSHEILPCFIFDPRQVGSQNSYGSSNAIQFMINSIKELAKTIEKTGGKLFLFYGQADQIIKKLIKNVECDALFINRDYTPFSLERDGQIEKICNKNNLDFHTLDDAVLNSPESVKTKADTPYAVYTPYFKSASQIEVQKPQKLPRSVQFYTKKITFSEPNAIFNEILGQENKKIFRNGGRKEGLKIIKHLDDFKDYKKKRDFPAIQTTGLSAHIKFGTLSLREIYFAIVDELGPRHTLIPQLYWHDFFTQVAFFNPKVFGRPYHEKYENLEWDTNKAHLKAWQEGKTGFPIVDAGMRELNTTGFMHNRCRMIVASFLTKDLHMNWLAGEKYFAQQLVDYDPCVNNGNWQWSASTGCDAQPYFRIFNPWLQQKKFDPECEYIKKWVPELKKVSPKDIHAIFKKPLNLKNYPNPIVDHKKESEKAKKLYKAAARIKY